MHSVRVDTRVQTGIKSSANRPDIFVRDKKKIIITIIEVGITSQDRPITVKTKKKRKYDILANKLGSEYKRKTNIIPCVMTWDCNEVSQEICQRYWFYRSI